MIYDELLRQTHLSWLYTELVSLQSYSWNSAGTQTSHQFSIYKPLSVPLLKRNGSASTLHCYRTYLCCRAASLPCRSVRSPGICRRRHSNGASIYERHPADCTVMGTKQTIALIVSGADEWRWSHWAFLSNRVEFLHQYFMHVCCPRVKFVALINCDHYVYMKSVPPH